LVRQDRGKGRRQCERCGQWWEGRPAKGCSCKGAEQWPFKETACDATQCTGCGQVTLYDVVKV
jgi:hypothetical protein